MASLPPGGKPSDKIPTPRVPRDIKKKSMSGGKPPASAKRDMYSKQAEKASSKKPKAEFNGGKKRGPSVPRQKPVVNPVRKTRPRRMIP